MEQLHLGLISTPFGFASTAMDVVSGVDLSGRRAVVTGASSGIGVETARALAATGCEVVLAVRDLAGNDVGYSIRKARKIPADERFSPILQRVFEAGRLGQKSGKGFYRYEGRTRISDPEIMTLIEGVSRDLGITRREIPDNEILVRLLCPLVNEGAKIVDEGIAIRASDVDIVYVNGYGFPSYKGGPMFWAQEFGFDQVIATMQKLAPTHGQRWRPAPLLERLAASGKGWSDAEKSG